VYFATHADEMRSLFLDNQNQTSFLPAVTENLNNEISSPTVVHYPISLLLNYMGRLEHREM
jgi:hypothetical protein